jgi:hypothetical protein
MSSALDTLARHLGVPTAQVPVLAAYDDAQVAAYDALLTRAMETEDAAFETALDEALAFVPRLLRPVARKVLGRA